MIVSRAALLPYAIAAYGSNSDGVRAAVWRYTRATEMFGEVSPRTQVTPSLRRRCNIDVALRSLTQIVRTNASRAATSILTWVGRIAGNRFI